MALELEPAEDIGLHQWNILASELRLNIHDNDAGEVTVEERQRDYGNLVASLVYETRSTLGRLQYDIESLQDRHPHSSLINGVMQFFFNKATGDKFQIVMKYRKKIPIMYMKFHCPHPLEDIETLERLPKEEILQVFNDPQVAARRNAASRAANFEEHRYRQVQEDSLDQDTFIGLMSWNAITQSTSTFLSSTDEPNVSNVQDLAARLGEQYKSAYDELRDLIINIQWEIEREQHSHPNSLLVEGVLKFILNRAAGGFAEFSVVYCAPLPVYYTKFSFLSEAQKFRPLF